jgi:glucose-1-phosphate cytidylyltransferase
MGRLLVLAIDGGEMKVVLFCGGLGTRLRDYSENLPKPMVNIGYRPLLWHVMKYYAHFGHKDFILCLGYKADVIKNYFRHYDECVSNDFVMSRGGRKVQLLNSDIQDWNITFVDTGIAANIGQRLRAVKSYLTHEEIFLANYTDGVTDLDLNRYIDDVGRRSKVASFLCVQPTQTFHVVTADDDGAVKTIAPVESANIWVNGGFFVLKNEIFDYLYGGEELVMEPFQRLISKGELLAYKYRGFWMAMDTFKDKERLDSLIVARGGAPWTVWNAQRAIGQVQEPRLPEVVSAKVSTDMTFTGSPDRVGIDLEHLSRST